LRRDVAAGIASDGGLHRPGNALEFTLEVPPVTEEQLNFRDMCARFEVTPRTLRYYEYIELLQPRREGRNRLYGPREVARMTLILRGRRFGFALEEIRRWLDIYDRQGTRPQLQAWIGLADRQLAVLRRQQAELSATIAELEELRSRTASMLDD